MPILRVSPKFGQFQHDQCWMLDKPSAVCSAGAGLTTSVDFETCSHILFSNIFSEETELVCHFLSFHDLKDE